jgi:hypothetical protein
MNLVSVFDYFHPNRDGQAQLAAVTYPSRFNW